MLSSNGKGQPHECGNDFFLPHQALGSRHSIDIMLEATCLRVATGTLDCRFCAATIDALCSWCLDDLMSPLKKLLLRRCLPTVLPSYEEDIWHASKRKGT